MTHLFALDIGHLNGHVVGHVGLFDVRGGLGVVPISRKYIYITYIPIFID